MLKFFQPIWNFDSVYKFIINNAIGLVSLKKKKPLMEGPSTSTHQRTSNIKYVKPLRHIIYICQDFETNIQGTEQRTRLFKYFIDLLVPSK